MKREISAGGVVWNRQLDKFLLIKDSYGRLALPKGLIEKGESPEQTALREIEEETGLKHLRVIEKLGEIGYFYQLKGDKISKTVIFFLVEASDTELMTSWEIQGATWFEPEKAIESIAYENSKEIVRKAVKRVRDLL